jgi:hypothetical protein
MHAPGVDQIGVSLTRATGYTFLPCRHCGGERDTCPRCGYLCCDYEPCACKAERASTAALKEMAFYDEHGCSEQELATRQLQEPCPSSEGPRR